MRAFKFWLYRLQIAILLVLEYDWTWSNARLVTGSASKEMWYDHWLTGLSPSDAIKEGWNE